MINSFEKEFDWNKYFIVSTNFIKQKENSEIEFKESFQSPRHKNKKLHKWIASFANSSGGLIIYGVKNDGEIVGLKDRRLHDFDNKDLTQELLDYFSPEIKFELFIKEINGFELGFLYIHEAVKKPVVTIKSADNTIQESDIFYRYPGQSRKICYAELKDILDSNYQNLNTKWMNLMNNIASIGVENVGLLNAVNGELIGSQNRLLIPEELLSKVKFINEGSFVEKDGAPALKLIGDVQSIDSEKIIQLIEPKFQIITHFELYNVFFSQNLKKDSAIEFFRKVLYENTVYYPIYYYLITSNISIVDLVELVKNENGYKKNEVLQRFSKEKDNFRRFEKGNLDTDTDAAKKLEVVYGKLKKEEEFNIKDIEILDLRRVLYAVTHLKEGEFRLEYILNLLKSIYDNRYNASSVTNTFLRQSICHIDLIVFGKRFFEKNDIDLLK